MATKINSSSPAFVRNIQVTIAMIVLLAAAFAVYVWSEKRIDHANERRQQMMLLVRELRQSSDDLTRMARAYVATGNVAYKTYHQTLIDIRNGKRPRPEHYDNAYWDLYMASGKPPQADSAQTIALLDLIRHAGFTPEEFDKLGAAKVRSDQLTLTEQSAMLLLTAPGADLAGLRARAFDLLYANEYFQAKAQIVGPINAVSASVDARTQREVRESVKLAIVLRVFVILVGIALITFLWRSYRKLLAVLGAQVDEVRWHIEKIGNGEFSQDSALRHAPRGSVMSWLNQTEHKLLGLAQHNQRLRDLYATLSACNQAIVRCRNKEELFQQICRGAVESGKMKMAWIGLLNPDSGLVEVVECSGDGLAYLEGLSISINPMLPSGQGPTGIALREGHAVWCQDFLHDPRTAPWHAAGARFGWHASASLPLFEDGTVVGAFTLYESVPQAFDQLARALLEEMAMDISFALSRFRSEARRVEAEQQLQLAGEVFQNSNDGLIVTDAAGNIIKANAAFSRITGYDASEVLGMNPRIFASGLQDRSFYQQMWDDIAQHGSWRGEVSNRRKGGTVYPQWLSITRVPDADGQSVHYIGVFNDITEQKQAKDRIHRLANFDVLTRLPNRVLLADRVQHALAHAQRSGQPLALMFLDLDHFKHVNDALGHLVGDELLKQIAARLGVVLRTEDTVARPGGDEFILLLPDTDASGAVRVAEKILQAVAQPFLVERHALNATLSIGIAMYPDDGADMDALFKNADAAMYRAKEDGRNNYCFFTAEMQRRADRRMALESALHLALPAGQLALHYQPQIAVSSGALVGAEVLLRWTHPELGVISPAEFIPIAEASGLILKIGEWVLRSAVAQASAWQQQGYAPVMIAVNLSALQFRQADLPQLVVSTLADSGLAPQWLELELTEGVAMSDPEVAVAMMDQLGGQGIRMSIDDFGTGYSSLAYLKRFHVYKLKIDQSFVRDITDDAEDRAIVAAVINMAKSLGMQTIAEGVETVEQLEYLRAQGCDEYQGYYCSRPVPAEVFVNFLGPAGGASV